MVSKKLSLRATAEKLTEDGVLADRDYLEGFLEEFRAAIAKEIQERIRDEAATVYQDGNDFGLYRGSIGFDTADVEDILEEYQVE
jgi:hypothetical protein